MTAYLLMETFRCVCCQDPEKVPPYLSGLLWRTPVSDCSLSGSVTNLASVFLLRTLQLSLHHAFIWSQETTGDHRRPQTCSDFHIKGKDGPKNLMFRNSPRRVFSFSSSGFIECFNLLALKCVDSRSLKSSSELGDRVLG